MKVYHITLHHVTEHMIKPHNIIHYCVCEPGFEPEIEPKQLHSLSIRSTRSSSAYVKVFQVVSPLEFFRLKLCM